MLKVFVKKYISIIFLLSTFLGVFHHHDDILQHNDCQICVIQSSIADVDTPSDTVYFTKLELFSESTKGNLPKLSLIKHYSQLNARAPPLFL